MLLEKSSPDSRKMKLKDVCHTRWIEQVNGLDTFEELFVAIFFTLDEMASNLE